MPITRDETSGRWYVTAADGQRKHGPYLSAVAAMEAAGDEPADAPERTTLDSEIGRLSPERRWSLYNRLADVLADNGAPEASRSARRLAAEAARQSPEIMEQINIYLDALREDA